MERDTVQRRAIREVFFRVERPLSPQEILEKAQREVPQLGIATVYRSLKAFTEQGWLQAVDLPGEPQRYERAGKDHHHHFSCNECGRMFEMEGCPADLQALVPPGFRMDNHEVFIYGLCADCHSR